MTEPLTIILPERPPPLSACFINAHRRGRVITPRYRAWTSLCQLRLGHVGHIPGAIAVDYMFARPDNRKRDLGNLEKAVSDLLVKMKVIEDDSMIQDLRMRWGGDAPVRVTITPWRGEVGA